MPNFFPESELACAQERFGMFAVQPIRSGGIKHPRTGKVLVQPGQYEGLIFSLINLQVLSTRTVTSMQFRLVPYHYPALFPTFYLVSPRSFRLVPDVYKNTRPEAAIQEGGEQKRDDPRNVGWDIDGSFSRLHFCQLEEVWNQRALQERNLTWVLGLLRGVLQNPLNVPYEVGARTG